MREQASARLGQSVTLSSCLGTQRAMGSDQQLEKLNKLGRNIGTWGEKPGGFYKPEVLYGQAESCRSAGIAKNASGEKEAAYVLLLRCLTFWDVVHRDKKLNKASVAYKQVAHPSPTQESAYAYWSVCAQFRSSCFAVMDLAEQLKKERRWSKKQHH